MSLNKQSSLMEKAAPMIHLVDKKDFNVGGGFASNSAYSIYDWTQVVWNTISGATLTTRNGSDVEVTSGTEGLHGRTDVPINSPTATQLDKVWVNLPEGTYHIQGQLSYHTDYQVYLELYNKSDTASVIPWGPYYGVTDISGIGSVFNGNFRVTGGTKQYQLRMLSTGASPAVNNKGIPNAGHTIGYIVHNDIKIYKIG